MTEKPATEGLNKYENMETYKVFIKEELDEVKLMRTGGLLSKEARTEAVLKAEDKRPKGRQRPA